ncbi:hypothetical protein ACM25N_12085 [Roseovarius sp. C7]|uniref:hypothetical protein n=1 Tax=Roseovarius sp. C7 TaxID=3398643 RepID=UPI0039F695B3
MDASKKSPDIAAMMRAPETVMRLDRMGSFHQTRLSFMRSLLRILKQEGWTFIRPVWRIDGEGVGTAVYQARGPERTYSLVAFAHDLDPSERTDRSIATAWDATFTMFDGVPNESDLERLSHCVPLQEAGRVSDLELTISRANRSVRLFNHVVERLAEGKQPDTVQIDAVGYLMRTTAVYGSGKFGAASREKIKARPEVSRPFHIEMLSVYLTRAFAADLVEHLAAAKAPKTAVKIDPEMRRRLGVGNSTGLGMAPYLINHPKLIHNWIGARETALARVRAQHWATPEKIVAFREALTRASNCIRDWKTGDATQSTRVAELCCDLNRLNEHATNFAFDGDVPWNALYLWGEETLSLEGQELLVSLLIEPFGELVDDLLDTMSADEETDFRIDGTMGVEELRTILGSRYGWAQQINFSHDENCARFWYVSANKAEPRLGERKEEAGFAQFEEPLDIAHGISNLAGVLATFGNGKTVAEFLLKWPRFRKLVRRIQIIRKYPYGEINDNIISAQHRPIDLLRCKLSFFGAVEFDPRSDRWVRINMYKHAPYPFELGDETHDNWAYGPNGGAE